MIRPKALISIALTTAITALAPSAGAAVAPGSAAESARGVDPQTFKPNHRGDHAPGQCNKADCTLREAVLAANATPAQDKILLGAGKPYRLTRELSANEARTGDLDVLNPLVLKTKGPGRARIKASGSSDRILHGHSAIRIKSVRLRGRGGTLSETDLGGVVLTDEDLTLVKVAVSGGDNVSVGGSGGALALLGSGDATLKRSDVASSRSGGAGAGIYRDGTGDLTLLDTTVARNRAKGASGMGGGVWFGSTGLFVMKRSTLSQNVAEASGGGMHVSDGVGAEVVNSTFAGNRARGWGGGVFIAPGGDTSLNAVTVGFNRADSDDDTNGQGGGLWAEGGSPVLFVRNSFLARNHTTNEVNEQCDAPTPVDIDSQDGNVLSTAASGCSFFQEPQDITGTTAGMKALADNGGPTKTIALRKSSGAINEADGLNVPFRDQRGVLRMDADAGSYER